METTTRGPVPDSQSATAVWDAPEEAQVAFAADSTKTWRMTGTEIPALKTMDQAVRAYMEQNNIPGGAIAVTRNGRLVFARGYS